MDFSNKVQLKALYFQSWLKWLGGVVVEFFETTGNEAHSPLL